MNKLLFGVILISIGLVAGYSGKPFIQQQLQTIGMMPTQEDDDSTASGEKKILYWVAPMDANYRRDKPGQSPMGMDLVPVYEGEGGEEGVVEISPIVQNNLGVRISSVKKLDLDRVISTVGYVTFDEEKFSHLHTRVEGWVEKLLVKAEGDPVKKGQKLFELYSPTLVNAQEEYLSALKSKNRILTDASSRRLVSLGVTSGQIRQLENTLKIRQRIDYFARHDGFIESMMIREGMFVKPEMDLMAIGQIDTVWVIAEVFERQSGWVKPGQTVDMSVAAYPKKTWKGTVDYIYPILDSKTRTLSVRIRFDNKDELLKPNMFSQLTIHSSFAAGALFVKREAIIRNGQMERVVKALGDGKFLSIAIKTGSESGNYIEVTEGLKENDQIVTSAQFLIDSESSLTASFERMEEPMKMAGSMQAGMQDSQDSVTDNNQVWIRGKIIDVMQDQQKLKVEHEAVAAWDWPEMQMDFPIIQSMNLRPMKPSEEYNFLVEKRSDGSIEVIRMNKEGLR